MSKKTREQLLQTAFEAFYHQGYYAVSLDSILAEAKVSKGSMYHFFASKKALMLAVINEKLMSYIDEKYSAVLSEDQSIMSSLLSFINDKDNYNLNIGCRVNNLVQELSHRDEDFKVALEQVYQRFEFLIEQVLQHAVDQGEIDTTDSQSLAMFVVAAIEGSMATAKKSQQPQLFNESMQHLNRYLKGFATNP